MARIRNTFTPRRCHTLYFLQAGDDGDGPIKIGATGNLTQRLREVSSDARYKRHGCKPTLLLAVEGGGRYEGVVHRALEEHRLTHEWFAPSYPVIDFIADALLQGLPFLHSHLCRQVDEEVPMTGIWAPRIVRVAGTGT